MGIFSKSFKIFLVLLLIYVMSITVFGIHLGYRKHLKRLHVITNSVISFVGENQGQLPTSKQQLAEYMENEEGLDAFDIPYGINLSELNEKQGVLYDQKGDHVLLIKGKTKVPFVQKQYEQCSVRIFEQAKQSQLEHGENRTPE